MEDFIRDNSNIIKSSNDVFCPIYDKKEYRILKLKNNLEIFFVKDKETVISSACLVVGVGQKDDFDDKLGIAHYLEHMLFLGSKKYEGSDQYAQFIENNGGSSNAHTSISKTWYHFDINSNKFMEALDIFGHFFICPLFDKTFIKNEVFAVNSEHFKNIGDDGWRSLEGMKKMLNQNHPASRFSTGSFETLLGTSSENNISDNNVTELRKSVKHFFETKYSADNMKLYIYHNDDSDNIINSVKSIFEQITIKSDNQKHKKTELFIPLENRIKLLKIIPVGDINTLSVCWILNRNCNRFGDNLITSDISMSVISHILGHEGTNSLCSFLRDKMLINNIVVYTSYSVDGKCMMDIHLSLTDDGTLKRTIILEYVYSFIAFMQSDVLNNKNYYINTVKELIIKNKLAIKNTPSLDPDTFLQNCANVSEDINIDLKYILIYEILISNNYDAHVESINRKLLEMSPNNSFVVLSAHSVENSKFLTEKYYGIKYIIESYRISDILSMSAVKHRLPNVNTLVKESLIDETIYTSDDSILIYPSKHDICYDISNKFNDDKIHIKMSIILTDMLESKVALNYVYLLFYISYIDKKYSMELYDLSMGLCNISLTLSRTSLSIYINAYKANIHSAIDTVKNYIHNTDPTDIKLLGIIREKLLRQYTNYKKLAPYKKLDSMVMEIFNKKYIVGDNEILEEINNINFENIKNVATKLLVNGHIQCAISGNINNDIGQKISYEISQIITHKQITKLNTTNDLDKSHTVFSQSENNEELNSACFTMFMLDDMRYGNTKWEKISCIILILSKLIHAEYFHQMRTLGKLGYVVMAKQFNINILTPLQKKVIYFLAQSTKVDVTELYDKTIDVIKNNITDKIKNVNSNEFISLKLGLLANLKSQDKNVADRIDRMLYGINNKDSHGNVNFNMNEKFISALLGDNPADILTSGVTLQDIIDYYNEKFVQNKTVIAIGINRNRK